MSTAKGLVVIGASVTLLWLGVWGLSALFGMTGVDGG